QSLLSRADLPQADRENALHELAQDYLKAGMLDRAEQVFEQVLDTRHALPALRSLIRIYESEHDCDRAIAAVKRLRGLTDEPVPQLVHYQCERALGAMTAPEPDFVAADQALEAAENAVQTMRDQGAGDLEASEARIAMLRARFAKLNDQPDAERAYLESVLTIAPSFGGLVAADLLQSYRHIDRMDEGIQLLRAHYQRHPSLDTFNVIFKALRSEQGYEPAWGFAREALRAHPSLLGLDRMLEAELAC